MFYLVFCTESGKSTLATRTPFPAKESAQEYMESIAKSRAPFMVEMSRSEIDVLYTRMLIQIYPAAASLPREAARHLQVETQEIAAVPAGKGLMYDNGERGK